MAFPMKHRRRRPVQWQDVNRDANKAWSTLVDRLREAAEERGRVHGMILTSAEVHLLGQFFEEGRP